MHEYPDGQPESDEHVAGSQLPAPAFGCGTQNSPAAHPPVAATHPGSHTPVAASQYVPAAHALSPLPPQPATHLPATHTPGAGQVADVHPVRPRITTVAMTTAVTTNTTAMRSCGCIPASYPPVKFSSRKKRCWLLVAFRLRSGS
jgi:hypothetical protein